MSAVLPICSWATVSTLSHINSSELTPVTHPADFRQKRVLLQTEIGFSSTLHLFCLIVKD
jgi:hypothetical protein